MKLHRLKILSDFRGLPAGFEISFTPSDLFAKDLEPICFVGLNGSGKSNVLEALSEIFFYLETYHLEEDKKALSSYKTLLGFEIKYCLPRTSFEQARVSWDDLEMNLGSGENHVIFCIKKRPNEFPVISALLDHEEIMLKNKDNNRNIGVLPPRIVG